MTEVTLNLRVFVGILIAGAALVGLLVASILNLRSARGRQERRYLMVMTPLLWIVALSMLALMYELAPPWRYVILIGYLLGLPALVYRTSLRRQLIREAESRSAKKKNGASSRPG